MDERIIQLEKTVSLLHEEVKEIRDLLGSGLRKVESNFDLLKNQVNSLNVSVEGLKGSTIEGFEDLGGKIETLTEEISKIGKVTKYDEYFKNLQAIKRLN